MLLLFADGMHRMGLLPLNGHGEVGTEYCTGRGSK